MLAADLTAEKSNQIFTRQSTGLVRAWSPIDAFFYNVLAIAIPTSFALVFSLVPFTFPGANIVLSIIIAAFLFVPVVITYSMMSATMPRSGGDYVFQSRILSPIVGFVIAFQFIFVLDALFLPISAVILSTSVLAPGLLAAGTILKSNFIVGMASWFASKLGSFVVVIAGVLFTAGINFSGMRTYARSQRFVFVAGLVGALVAITIFASSSNSHFISSFDSFVKASGSNQQDAYHGIIAAAVSAGFLTSQSSNILPSLLSVSIIAFSFTGIIWSVENAGEIRRADYVRRQIAIILGALTLVVVLVLALGFFIVRTVGYAFLASSGYLFFNGNPAYPISIGPYFALFDFVLNSNPIVIGLILFWLVSWTIYAMSNGPLGGARMMLAASFDRVLPAKMSAVSDRFHVPTIALAIFTILALIFGALYVFWSTFSSFTLDVIFSIVAMELLTCIAATILPFRKKQIYESSVISKYKLGNIPIISITGFISTVFLAWLIYLYATVGSLGVNSLVSAGFLAIVYGVCVAIYLCATSIRRKQGVDITLAYKEIPPE